MPASLSPRILHPSSDTLLPSTGPLPPRFFRSNSRDESGFSSINRWPLALAPTILSRSPETYNFFFFFSLHSLPNFFFFLFFLFLTFNRDPSFAFLYVKSTEIFFLIGSNMIVSAHVTRKFVYTSIKISPKETGSARSFSLYSPIVQANSSIDFGS